MNIWYISKYASPSKYFFGTRHFYLSEEWVKMGNDVTIITSNSSHLTNDLPQFKSFSMKEMINGVKVVWLNVIQSKTSSGFKRILSWLQFDLMLLFLKKKELSKPDIIIVSSLSLTAVIPGYILAKKYKSKFVFEVRDIWPLSIIKLGGYNPKNFFVRILSFVEKFGYEKADLIVGTMPNLIEHVNHITKRYKKCICIPQGLSTDFYEFDQQELKQDYVDAYLPKVKFIVCYAGTINANNPLDSLIEAARILKNNSNIHFVILGNGSEKERLINDTSNLENITFPPAINKNQVNSFLNHVHICYDSFESDLAKFGLSRNKWIDYMYAAKPIVCSYDGYRSMINEADCGSFVKFNNSEELADEIQRYSQINEGQLREIGERGKRYLLNNRKFSILGEQYLNEIRNS